MALIGKENNKSDRSGVGRSKVVLSFILGLALGAVGMWVAFGNIAFSPTILPDPSELLDDKAVVNTTSVEYIVVEDQLAGERVLINEISISVSSWAVVHEDVGGVPGNALGAQRFDKGLHSGTIDLLRSTNFNQNYYVLLYRDDGDRKFDLEKDSLVIGDDNNPIGDTFQVIRIDRKIN